MDEEPYSPIQREFNKSALETKEVLSSAHWNELRTFLAVAKHSSFKQAAQALNLSHPTVSRQVKHLEHLMKTKLVASTGYGTFLTDAGRALAHEVAKIDSHIFNVERTVRTNLSRVQGSVRVSITDGLAAFWLAPHLGALINNERSIELDVSSTQNMVKFEENNADMLLGYVHQDASFIHCVQLGNLHLVPIISHSYAERYGVPSPSNLHEHVFIQLDYYADHMKPWAAWNEARSQGKFSHRCDNSIVYGMMVKSGCGIGLLGTYAVMEPAAIPIDLGFTISLPLYASIPKDKLELPHCAKVFQLLCDLFSLENPWFAETPNLQNSISSWDRSFRYSFNL